MILDFDMVDLRLFVNVVETQSLTRGAERSNLSTPAASARIKKLERAFRAQLFLRTSQGFKPTPASEAVLKHARILLRQIEQLDTELVGSRPGLHGTVRLYANTLSISELLPHALHDFLVNFPRIDIELHERTSLDISAAVKDGTADVGILSADVPDGGLESIPYRTERLVLITPKNHKFAGSASMFFHETLCADFVGLTESSALQSFVVRAASRSGTSPRWRIQANSFETLCRLVETGVGIGVVPESVARRNAQQMQIAIVSLRDDWSDRRLKIAVRSLAGMSDPVRKLIDFLCA